MRTLGESGGLECLGDSKARLGRCSNCQASLSPIDISLDRAAISGEDQFTHLHTRKTEVALGNVAIVPQVV